MKKFKANFKRDASHLASLTLTLAFAFCSLHAADMSGDFNTWLGYIAGINADGNRSTVMGAGAGGEAKNLVRTDFMGAAAGAYAANLTDCIGIGFRSLMNASNMSDVVAIGTDALKGAANVSGAVFIGSNVTYDPDGYYDSAVDINGKFIVHGGSAIIRNHFGVDLFHYANGRMTLIPGDNEEREIFFNVTRISGPPAFSNALAAVVNSDYNEIKEAVLDLQAYRAYYLTEQIATFENQIAKLTTALTAATNRIAQLEAKIGN